MRTDVVIAVLLLLHFRGAAEYKYVPCDDGWSHIDENRCVKHINISKTFHEAQEHCRNLTGDLVSLHGYDEMFMVIFLTRGADPRRQSIWIGAQRSGTVIKNNDGSDYNIPAWLFGPNKYRGSKACIRLNVKGWGSFNHVRCPKRKRFVCAKNMSTSTPDTEPSMLQSSPVPDGPQPSPVPV